VNIGEVLNLSDISGWSAFGALALLLLVSVVRGWFQPRRSVTDLLAGRDLLIAELRRANEASEKKNAELMKQNAEWLELGRTSAHVLSDLPKVGDYYRDVPPKETGGS
jgi:uncharacterized protein YjiS (DUF1127 family)